MATNIPPHNLREVIDACICVLDDPEATLADLMQHIQGPDFPTKGIIMGRSGIRAAYATGRGRITVRGHAEFEEFGHDRTRIIISELPYQVNKKNLVEAIADQVKEKRLEGISDLRDESDRNGMRVVIELKKDANPQVVLNRLYAQTALQTTFSVNMLALVNDQTQPRILSLRHVLDEYLGFQQEVIVRRTKFDLKKAEERAHILEGLLIAQDNIDEVIQIIRSSYDDAKERLMERFGLSELQAQTILDMRLKALQGLEREKLQNEYDELQKRIAYFKAVLADENLVKQILKEELTAIRNRYGDDRRTRIEDVEDDLDIEDLIEEKECCYTLSNTGYIKRMAVDVYHAQRRGGRGVTAQSLKEEDYIKSLFVASTHDYLLFFTSLGKVHRLKGYRIPEASRTARGTAVVNVLPLEPGEKVTAMLLTRSMEEERYLTFVTKKGTVKRLELKLLNTARKAGIRALSLEEGDELVTVLSSSGEDNIIMASHDGLAICFSEQDVRCMGRDAVGVRGMNLAEGDYIVGAGVAEEGTQLLTVTERGFGKRTVVEEYLRLDGEIRRPQSRGGKGMKNLAVTERTGKVAGVCIVRDSDDIMIIEEGGVIIRMPARDVNVYRRDAQGVILMRVGPDSRVSAVQAVQAEEASEEESADA